jgi:hypothetical protein
MVSFRIVINYVLVTVATFTCGGAWADYDAAKLRQVAGGYLDAVHVATELQQSRCGIYFKKETDSFAQVTGDLASYLNPADLAELQSFLQSGAFRRAQVQTREFLEDWIQTLDRTNHGEQASCETIGAGVAKIYDSARTTWELAKLTYGR